MISCFFFERTRPAASMRPPCLIYLSASNNGTAGSIGPRIRKYLHTSQQYCTVMKSGEAHSLEDATGWFKLSLLRCSRRIWLGCFSCSLSPIQNQSQPTKNYLLWEKKLAQIPLLTQVCLWLGSSSVSEFSLCVFQANRISVK